jgi:hypothetical protein
MDKIFNMNAFAISKELRSSSLGSKNPILAILIPNIEESQGKSTKKAIPKISFPCLITKIVFSFLINEKKYLANF